jgi:hypothetical protein
MQYSRYAAGALAAAALISTPAQAQSADSVAALRRDMETMRKEYESKVTELEARLAKAEADAAQASATTAALQDQPVVLAEAIPSSPTPTANANPNAFNPGIAAVLNGFLTVAKNDPSAARIRGIAAGDEQNYPARGFSLGESEVSLAANIDPYLSGFLVFSMDNDNQISVEESYIRTTGLPAGLTLTAGRFFSGIGYINEQHAHNWAFSDTPLPYRAFLNSKLGDDGVQLRWLAPTDRFLEFGAELYRGDSFPAASALGNGVGAYTAFVRTGGDIDVSNSWLAGLSYLHARSENRESQGSDLFTGTTDLAIASVTYKWAPNGNPLVHNLTANGELFFDRDRGQFNAIAANQSRFGWYGQAIYQFMPRWRAGLRVAGLHSSDPVSLLSGSALDDLGKSPFVTTGLIEWDPSEFSRLRLQYSRDESDFRPNDVMMLQYTVIYGVHGAHRY